MSGIVIFCVLNERPYIHVLISESNGANKQGGGAGGGGDLRRFLSEIPVEKIGCPLPPSTGWQYSARLHKLHRSYFFAKSSYVQSGASSRHELRCYHYKKNKHQESFYGSPRNFS